MEWITMNRLRCEEKRQTFSLSHARTQTHRNVRYRTKLKTLVMPSSPFSFSGLLCSFHCQLTLNEQQYTHTYRRSIQIEKKATVIRTHTYSRTSIHNTRKIINNRSWFERKRRTNTQKRGTILYFMPLCGK